MQAIQAASKETVPGVPSRLPALAGEAFGTFVLPLSGTATLLVTARIGRMDLPHRPARRRGGRRLGLAVPQARPPARRGGTRSRAAGPGRGRSTAPRRRPGKVPNSDAALYAGSVG